MAHTLRADVIDFTQYARETDAQQKVKPASLWVRQLADQIGQARTERHAFLPWRKTHDQVHFRPGEVTLWGGVNGQGKSLITGQVALSLCAQGERTCIASFEMKPHKTLARMARQFSGYRDNDQWAQQPEGIAALRDIYEQFGGWTDTRLWLYDQQGTADSQLVIGMVRYCAKELGIRHVFIDSLMKCVHGEDDYNGQKEFVNELCSLARDNDVHIHLVHHIRKLSDDFDMPDKADIKGSGSITDQVDNVLLWWRNLRKEADTQAGKSVKADDPDAIIRCAKQRNGEWEGRIGLFFDKESMQYVGLPGGTPMSFYDFPHGVLTR